MSRISTPAEFKKHRVGRRRSIGIAALLVVGALMPAAALAGSGSTGLTGSAPENGIVWSGPIWGGRQHQPRLADVIERQRAQGQQPGISADASPAADQLYRRILEQSNQALPTSLERPE
jgi:hypothetical protein